ncbi:MAG: superoxide dismutase, partial [Opitutales bacterium]|nr:superoxide dismutase [Opitutales bacterium]
MSYIQTPLPYDVNALEPAMDAETLSIHYGKHHATYTKNLNAALEKHPEFTPPRCPGKLLMEIDKVPPAIFNAVRNFGGGHFNHAFFWKCLSAPRENNQAVGELAKAIDAQFGSFQAFRDAFTAAATGLFGSGWTWLVLKDNGKLAIVTTPNQDSPLMPESIVGAAHGRPLLA